MNAGTRTGENRRFYERNAAKARWIAWKLQRRTGAGLRFLRLGLRGNVRAESFPPAIPMPLFLLSTLAALPALAQSPTEPPASVQSPASSLSSPYARVPTFPRVHALDLDAARALALRRSSAVALASAKVAQSQADLREQQRRVVPTTTGGLDVLTQRVRYYVGLDLERLLQTNGAAREKSRQLVAAETIGKRDAEAATVLRVTTAWYTLRRADVAVQSAERGRETAEALHVAADARFRAGQGELPAVLASLSAVFAAEDVLLSARQAVALASLDLAQACGFLTAEDAEVSL